MLDDSDSSSEESHPCNADFVRHVPHRFPKRVRNVNKAGTPGTSKAFASKPISSQRFPGTNFAIANKIFKYFKPTGTNTRRQDKPSTSASNCNDQIEAVDGSEECSDVSKTASRAKKRDYFKRVPYCFGLLGDDLDENRPNHFDRLPVHVLETIFCQIPFLDLMHYRLVCTTWNDVIRDENFIRWKKLYYGLKKGKKESCDFIEGICKKYELSSVEECFGVLITYMSDDFGTKPSLDMYDFLSRNPKAIDAELVLAERLPEVLTKESKTWCILTTAILLSENVWDVQNLYLSLTTINSEYSLHDVTNALYCIATFLLYFTKAYKINHGLHYRVYCALYWIENTLPSKGVEGFETIKANKGLPGQQSLHMYCEPAKSNLTFEQLRILNHCFQHGQVIKIVALAGTGKTTTLIHLAQLYPQVKFLNVMFNKAVCEAAKERFPPNVTCRTAHSLAFTVFGHRLRSKLGTKVRPHDIVTDLKHVEGARFSIHTFAKYVLSTLENFVASADRKISRNHVPMHVAMNDEDRTKIVKDSIQIWEKMIDKENKNLRITHDIYLKLYQLSKPKLSEYQCLMVDEAQDCNPAILDIMMSQDLPVILVGDPNQQIYGFRGANNALQSIRATHTYHLTKSFRFGPEISYIAACCLDVLKHYTEQTIVGSDKPSSVNGTVEGQYAIIARTNVQLFNEAIRICCLQRFRNNEPTTILGSFAGGLRSYGYDQMLDILKLLNHSGGPAPNLSDKFLSKFKSFRDLTNYAKSVEDNELLSKIELVSQHGENIPKFISILKEKCSYSLSQANVVFSTAHKAKGLEFDTVCLTDDYPIVTGFESTISERRDFEISLSIKRSLCDDESNIMYVALTRAKKCLLLPDKLLRILLTAQEKFEYPVSSKKYLDGRDSLECVNCTDEFTPHTVLVLSRRKIVTAYGRTIRGGELCMKCATEPTVRPRVQIEPVVMYLDPTPDYAHRSMASLVGPLPSDPPIVRESFGAFNEMDVVYIINVNL